MELTARLTRVAFQKTEEGITVLTGSRIVYLRIVDLDADATVPLPQLIYEEVFNQR